MRPRASSFWRTTARAAAARSKASTNASSATALSPLDTSVNGTYDDVSSCAMVQTGQICKGRAIGFAAIVALASLALATSASAKLKDPRLCLDGKTKTLACARDNARLALRRRLAIIEHSSQPLYQGPTDCHAASRTGLAWACTYGVTGIDKGTATVRYRALSTGWHIYITLTPVSP